MCYISTAPSNKYNSNGKYEGIGVYHDNDAILNRSFTCYMGISNFKVNVVNNGQEW